MVDPIIKSTSGSDRRNWRSRLLLACAMACFALAVVLLIRSPIFKSAVEESTLPDNTFPVQQTVSPPARDIYQHNRRLLFEEALCSELEEELEKFCQSTPGTWQIHVELLENQYFSWAGKDMSENGRMVSASLIKLFVMAAVYDRIDQGLIDHGEAYPLIFDMITLSDNRATNQLISMLGGGSTQDGMNAVNAFAGAYGFSDSKLNRLMLQENGQQNFTSARDCSQLLKMIYSGTCVNEEFSSEMLEILKAQSIRNRIPAGLPEGTVCANKTGDLLGLCCADVGIVFCWSGDYILSVICNNPPEDGAAAKAVKALSAQIYSFLGNQYREIPDI
ncbi:MAG: serine hydrolase [Faecousia sp.]